MIALKDALTIMNSKEKPFEFEFVKISTGEIVKMKNCRLVGSKHNMKDHRTISVINEESNQIRTAKIHLIGTFNGEAIQF
jgi:hypothetical protein